MMRAYGLPDQVPVGDAALVRSLAEYLRPAGAAGRQGNRRS